MARRGSRYRPDQGGNIVTVYNDFVSQDPGSSLYHAHGGGGAACWRPPSAVLGWCCPYGTFDAARETAERMISIFLPLPERFNDCLQARPLTRYVMHNRYEITGARKTNGRWEFRSAHPGKRPRWHGESVIVAARIVADWTQQ